MRIEQPPVLSPDDDEILDRIWDQLAGTDDDTRETESLHIAISYESLGDVEGHPFRGNQWTTVYHGTQEEALASIKTHGLVPHGIVDMTGLKPIAVKNLKGAKVYVAQGAELARKYAREYQDEGKRGVLLRITLPPQAEPLVPGLVPGSLRFPGTIKPEWIEVEQADGTFRKLEEYAAGRRTLWCVLLLDGEPDDASDDETHGDVVGHPFRGNQWTTGQGGGTDDGDDAQARADREEDIKLAADRQRVTDTFSNAFRDDPNAMVEKYMERFGRKNGGYYIAADDAKELSEDFSANDEARGLYSGAVHETSTEIAELAFANALAQPVNPGHVKAVLFTGGGPGAGKTYGLKYAAAEVLKTAHATFDSTLGNTSGSRLENTLAQGYKAVVFYTYRDPEEAFIEGVLPRALEQGRALSVDMTLGGHEKSWKNLAKLQDKYGSNPNVVFKMVHNAKGRDPLVIDRLPADPWGGKTREQIRERIYNRIDGLFREGKLSYRTYRGFGGSLPRRVGGSVVRHSDQEPEPWGERRLRFEALYDQHGDEPGHPFRGNQWTGGAGGGSAETDGDTPLTVPMGRVEVNDPEYDGDGDGVSDFALIGGPGNSCCETGVQRLPNLTPQERAVEERFARAFEADPDGLAAQYREQVEREGSNVFATDDAKNLSADYAKDNDSKAQYTAVVHATANAVAKRAFMQALDRGPASGLDRTILVTNGGVAAGKGGALMNANKEGAFGKVGFVWDSAGEQAATENPWIMKEAEARGYNVVFAYVHSDPMVRFAGERGVVTRAIAQGRMVDLDLYAHSYADGARNFQAFADRQRTNQHASFVYFDNGTRPATRLSGIPKEALHYTAEDIYERASRDFEAKRSSIPDSVYRGGTIGSRIFRERRRRRSGGRAESQGLGGAGRGAHPASRAGRAEGQLTFEVLWDQHGDTPGHPFRGNQWTAGQGGDGPPDNRPQGPALDIGLRTKAALEAPQKGRAKALAAKRLKDRIARAAWGKATHARKLEDKRRRDAERALRKAAIVAANDPNAPGAKEARDEAEARLQGPVAGFFAPGANPTTNAGEGAQPDQGPIPTFDPAHWEPIEHNLSTGAVATYERAKAGVSDRYVVELADGTAACFKPSSGEYRDARPGIENGYAAEREAGAWEVAKLVGMADMVAPVQIRNIDVGKGAEKGSCHLWLEGKPARKVPEVQAWGNGEDVPRTAAFDFMVGNTDRHRGNWLIDPEGKVKLIDHGLSFPRKAEGRSANDSFVMHVSDHHHYEKPMKYMKPYADAWPKIAARLKEIGLSQRDVSRMKQRVEVGQTFKSWREMRQWWMNS